jgi:glycosyltransferase involved in cell wall biosynthesis
MGHTVQTVDVDLRGWDRWLAAARTFSFDRVRWGVRYRLSSFPRQARSAKAERLVGSIEGPIDFIIQIGATFGPLPEGSPPTFLYCDSNIKVAQRELGTGFSPARVLSPSELSWVAEQEGRVYRSVAGIFAISARLAASFIADFGLQPDRVHAVHSGPNLDPADIPERLTTRGDRPPTILFVGAQFERKGGDTLLRAFRRVRAEIPDARLLVVGPDRLPAVEPGVECLGYLRKNDPAEWRQLVAAYANSDVFCMPTRYEPFGIVFIEAMHFGLPCVGADTWAVPEIVREGETGYTVPAEDEPALAARLVLVLKNPVLASRLGASGKALAGSYFSWHATVDRMLAAVQPVLAAAERPRLAAERK